MWEVLFEPSTSVFPNSELPIGRIEANPTISRCALQQQSSLYMGACPQHWRHNDKDKDLPPFVDTMTQLASKRTAGDIARDEARERIVVAVIVAVETTRITVACDRAVARTLSFLTFRAAGSFITRCDAAQVFARCVVGSSYNKYIAYRKWLVAMVGEMLSLRNNTALHMDIPSATPF